MKLRVEGEFTGEGKAILHFCADGVKFWEGVMLEVSEDEATKWIPNFDNLPVQTTYVDPEFIEFMWEICIYYGYVSQDYDTLETVPDRLKIITQME